MLHIRPHKSSDIPLRVKWLNNPQVSQYIGDCSGEKTTLAKERKWFEAYKKNPQKKFFTFYVDGQPIGFMGLSNIQKIDKNADLFIAIGEDAYRGKGYGKQALIWLLDYAFYTLKLHKVNLGVVDANKRAIRLYKFLGFVMEGRKREELLIGREWHDMFSMAMFRKNWKSPYVSS